MAGFSNGDLKYHKEYKPIVPPGLGASLEAQLATFRRSDEQREALLYELVREVERLELDNKRLRDDYENEVESRRNWQLKMSEEKRGHEIARSAMDSDPFILALIDGDGACFQDALLQAGSDGGSETAYLLTSAIKSHIHDRYPGSTQWPIMIQIYANLEALSKYLSGVGIIKAPEELRTFCQAFNRNQALCNIIDVGYGKELADHKVRETFRLYVKSYQCRHIFFGGCHDNGYLPILEQFKRDANIASRITLLETLPMMPGFRSLGFNVAKFDAIFRSDPLPARAVRASPKQSTILPERSASALSNNTSSLTASTALHATATAFSPPAAKVASVTPATSSVQPPSAAASTWSAISKTASAEKNISIAPKKSEKPAVRNVILLNRDQERIDEVLPESNGAVVTRLYDRINSAKICNDYHIHGACRHGSSCNRSHEPRMVGQELIALRNMVRNNMACPTGWACRQPDCYYGHTCPQELRTKFCSKPKCRYEWAHGIDTVVVREVDEDGHVRAVI